MGKKSEEEIKIVYDGPKYVRGGSHLGDIYSRWIKPSYHPGFSSKLHHNEESSIG